MPWWLLFLFIFGVWLLWAVTVCSEKAVKEARKGIPKGQRRGVSLAPIIPLMPLGFWSLALVIDVVIEPWGTWTIAGFHALFAIMLAISLIRNTFHLQSLDKTCSENS